MKKPSQGMERIPADFPVSNEVAPALPTVAFMQANHARACSQACTLWKGDSCQQPKVSEVMGRRTELCVRPLRDTLTLASRGNG